MTLNIRTQTVHTVDYSDLEDFVKEVYGHEFSIPSDLESSNDVSHEFSVDGKVSEYDSDDLAKFKADGTATGESGYSLYLTPTLLNDLARENLIPIGNYIVRVSW